MKLLALLAAALLLTGCPGNTAQNAPTPPQGVPGRPETPGVASVSTPPVFSAPRSAPDLARTALNWDSDVEVQGRTGAPTEVRVKPPAERRLLDRQEGAPLFARTNIGTAAGAIRGTARWFATGPNGVAAAGPRLRAALGSHWRGTLVGITYRGRTIWTRLGDFCACGSGSIIDLPDEVFARFAPLSVGVLSVTVHWGDRNVLPATSTEDGWKP